MLKLTRLADYGVVLMTYMAGSRDTVRSAQSISEATGIPLPTVSKLLSSFARSGLLQAARGRQRRISDGARSSADLAFPT